MTDAERIWLEPECCAEPGVGRTWCSVNEWTCCPAGECDAPKPAEYVRADLVAAREAAAAEAMREACAQWHEDCADEYFARANKARSGTFEGSSWRAAAREHQEYAEAMQTISIPAADALARALEQARAEEREACAEIAEDQKRDWSPDGVAASALEKAARAIRAQGKEVGGE